MDAGGGFGPHPVHARLRRSARGHRRVRRRSGALPGGHVRPLRRRGAAAGHRRPVRGDQGPDRRLDGDRRRDLRAGARAGRRAVRGSGCGWEADPRVARGAPVPGRAPDHHGVTHGGRGPAADPHPHRDRHPRPSRSRLRGGRGCRAGRPGRGRARVAGRPAAGPQGLAGHRGLAQVPRRRPRRYLPTAPRGTRRGRAHARHGPGEVVDDTLQLYFLCAHPSLTPASAVALTLRAVGGLTTRQIAQAYLVPEATMAQRISRAKRTVSGVRFNQPGDVATVLRVLYLVFNEGYSGDVDLAGEAIRLTRQLAAKTNHEEVAGLLALMLLHHARRPARTGPDGRLVPLAEQDRSLWNTRLIAEGVDVLQTALARDRLGEFQAQAAIAALHADARTVEETDWVQIVEWYDELVRLTDSPVARLNRAVAVGEADGPRAGLAALAELDPALPRHAAVAAYLHERDGDPVTAARLYAEAARSAPNLPERDHLTRQAARLNAELRS